MKLSIAAATALPLLASGYSMGGPFRRPVIITNGVGPYGVSGGRCNPSNADEAFKNLKKDLKASSVGPRGMTKEEAARQRDWLNRAFGLATEAAAAAAGVDVKEGNEALRQQQEWLGKALFGVDMSGETSTRPRFDVDDQDDKVTVTMDVPGVKLSDIDISLEDNVLTIKGERQLGSGEVTRKSTFSQKFELDSTVEADKITAKLSNGVLSVSAPKNIPVPDIKKITVMLVEDDDEESDAPEPIEADVEEDAADDKSDEGKTEENTDSDV